MNNSYIKLATKKRITVKYIYHIGDIHIKNKFEDDNNRLIEFQEIQKKVIDEIKMNDSNLKNSIIVITGDIIDNKDKYNDFVRQLTRNFILSLANLVPVIMICGNHDCNQHNENDINYLNIILKDLETSNKFYILEKSGLYVYNNIIFCYTDLFSNNITHIDDEIKKQIMKECRISQKTITKIGLYHGDIYENKYQNNNLEERNLFSKNDFKNFDYVLLGDIHDHNFLDENEKICYCGSLFQQRYTEKIDHGYVLWNLEKKHGKFNIINNNFVRLKFHYDCRKIYEEQLEKYKNKKIYLIVFFDTYVANEVMQKFENEMKQKYNIVEYIKKIKKQENMKIDNAIEKYQKYLDKSDSILKMIKYYINTSNQYINLEMNKEEFIRGIENIMSDKDISYEPKKRIIKLEELKFRNTMKYGNDKIQEINFDKLENIINIKGKNCYGKSTICDIICNSFFDKNSRHLINNQEFINCGKKNAETEITFNVDNDKYRIKREWKKTNKSENMLDVRRTVKFQSFNIKDKKWETKTKNRVDKSDKDIQTIIGNIEQFNMTTLLNNKPENNFILMNPKNRFEWIINNFEMGVFDNVCTKLNSEIFYLRKIIKELTISIPQNLDELKIDLDKHKNTKKEIENKILEQKKNQKEILKKYFILEDNLNKNKIKNVVGVDENKINLLNKELEFQKEIMEKKFNLTRNMSVFDIEKKLDISTNEFENNNKFIKILTENIEIKHRISEEINNIKIKNENIRDLMGELKKTLMIKTQLEDIQQQKKFNDTHSNILKYENEIKRNSEIGDLYFEELLKINKEIVKINNMIDDIPNIKKTILEKENSLSLHNELVKILKKGIIQDIANGICQKLSLTINKYLNQVETYKIDVKCENNQVLIYYCEYENKILKNKVLIENSSNHEESVMYAICKIAFNEISLTQTNFLILDEPFKSSDNERKKKVGKYFELIKSKFDIIFLVSHDPDIIKYSDIVIELNIDNENNSYINDIKKNE